MTRVLAASIIVLGFAVPASAQPPQWTEKVKLGKPIFVTIDAGDRVDGRAVSVADEGLVVSTPIGIRTVPYREIRRVQKRDDTWTGAVIGVAVGIAVGMVGTLASDCVGPRCRAEKRGLVMTGALYGGLTGWAVDGHRDGKTTLFQADASRRLTVAPRRGGMSAGVSFNW